MKQNGETYEQIAKEYENISEHSLKRHAANHMKNIRADDSVDAQSAEFNPDSLIPDAERIAWQAYADAIKTGNTREAMAFLKVATELTSMRRDDDAKKKPEPRPEMMDSVMQSPEWKHLLNKIWPVISKYPDIAAEVLDALELKDFTYVKPTKESIAEEDMGGYNDVIRGF